MRGGFLRHPKKHLVDRQGGKGMKKYLIIVSLVATIIFFGFAAGVQSSDFGIRKNAWEVGAFGGYFVMEGNQWLEDAPSVGGKAGYFFTKDLQLQFMFNYNPSEYSKDLAPSFKFLEGRSVDLYHYRAELLYHFLDTGRFIPYLALGSGLLQLDGADIDNKLDAEF